MDENSDRYHDAIRRSTIYDVRRAFTRGEKKAYTVEEIGEMLDKLAFPNGAEVR